MDDPRGDRVTDTEQALVIFDALCGLRVRDFVDDKLVGEIVDALAVSGRAAELMTRFVAPVRESVLRKLSAESWHGTVGETIPAGVLELLVTLLPQIPPPPRKEVERLIGSAAVRAEVRRLLQATVSELVDKLVGKGVGKSVLGRAASAGKGLFGAISSTLGTDMEARIGDAVDFGVGLAQRRLVELVSSPETARRAGNEVAQLLPRLAEVKDRDVASALQRQRHALLDGLVASLIAHNAGRASVRALTVDETREAIERHSELTIGELLDRLGLRAPLRGATERLGGAVVAAVRTR